MFNTMSYIFIFFGGFMSMTMVLGKLLEDKKRTYHYMFSGMMFCLGALQLIDGLLVMEKLEKTPALIFWHIPFLAWIGPFFFLAFKSANIESYRLKLNELFHFLPGTLVICAMIPLIIMDKGVKLAFIKTPPDITSPDPLFQFYSILSAFVLLMIIGYLVYFSRECFFMIRVKKKKLSYALIIIILLSFPLDAIFFSSMLTISHLGAAPSYYLMIIQVLTALSFLLTLAIFIMERKNIHFFQTLSREVRQRRYEINKNKNLNVSLIVQRIISLMEEEKIFSNEELSVNTMAEKLDIKSYQLSRVLNENFDKNFNSYVNEYRILEARKILIEDSSRTIISIAYAVGFNSTTVFNEWFKRITGVSPRHFRKTEKG